MVGAGSEEEEEVSLGGRAFEGQGLPLSGGGRMVDRGFGGSRHSSTDLRKGEHVFP